MILKSLEIENIRSYTNQPVTFPHGITLFEGDIGSGKSTILNAIEFALFGLGSQKGGSLLRLGTKKGSVTLTFEVEAKEYKIHRALIRKGNSIGQGDDGYIETAGERILLSPTELKERILELLNFNEPPDPKAQSVIYRYAIFTPQEEMKEILAQNADKRLQTLRKAFGIEDYKIAGENARNTAGEIKRRSSYLAGQISDLDEKEGLLKITQSKIVGLRSLTDQLIKHETDLDEKVKKAREELEKFQKEREEIEKIKAEIPHHQKTISDMKLFIDKLSAESRQLADKISENQPTIDKLSGTVSPTDKSEEELVQELSRARYDEKSLRREDAQIEAKINDYEFLKKNGTCPTCDRPANPEEFQKKIEERNNARTKLSDKIRGQEELVKKLDSLRLELRDYISAQKELKSLRHQVNEWYERIQKNDKDVEVYSEQITEAKKNLDSALAKTKGLENISKQIEALEKQKKAFDEELRIVRKDIDTNKGTIVTLESEIERLNTEVNRKKEQKSKIGRLNDHNIWLSDYFIPTLDIIERHVMGNIHQEFNQQFQKWFNMLIEDPDLEVKIDEDFTPAVDREGYDQDITSLSGGEKTSVALAYRLALNTIVQKVSIGMKSNLLILDEPTDGFSKEQLFKVKEILNELRCPQVILVSHEKELESFADTTCRVEKMEGQSRLDSISEGN